MDDFKNKKDKAVGEVVERIGQAIDDSELEFKGKMKSLKADLGSKVEEGKDKFFGKANEFIDEVTEKRKNK